MGREAVIVSAARTPFGAFQGALRELSATDLGAVAIREAVRRAELLEQPEEVDQVLMGQVVQAGAGQIPSRQAAHKAGLPFGVVSATVNKVCASSLWAVNLADALIRAGDAQVMVAGGMETMSNAPYICPGRAGASAWATARSIDGVITTACGAPSATCTWARTAAAARAKDGISREEQDAWAFRSHSARRPPGTGASWRRRSRRCRSRRRRASRWCSAGRGPRRRDTSLEALAKLKPVFEPNGPVTAGNAPSLNDGAGALVVMSRD